MRAAKAVAVEAGQEPAVIDVRVREQHGVDRARVEGELAVEDLGLGAPSLEQSAVEQKAPPLELEQMPRAGDRPRGAVEGDVQWTG